MTLYGKSWQALMAIKLFTGYRVCNNANRAENKYMNSNRFLALWFFFLLGLLPLLTTCTSERSGGETPRAVERTYTPTAWPAVALLGTGRNPIWFELAPDGPVHIESAAAAELSPYTPWPHARFISGMLLWDGFLVMAVNGDGFLVLGPSEAANLALYRVSHSLWEPYTTGSFFLWNDKPTVLLYRNDFFSAPAVPPLSPQTYVLDRSSPAPLGVSVPALESLSDGGSREAELAHMAADGFWYFRVKEKDGTQNETAYFRTAALSQAAGEEISVDEWRNSGNPEWPRNVSLHLTYILDRALELVPGKISAVNVLSPEFERPRLFSSARGGESLAILHSYSREGPEPMALVIREDGRGFICEGKEPEVKPFALPALPEGFLYTGIALVEDAIVATWEEQQEAGIGAAGFMVMGYY